MIIRNCLICEKEFEPSSWAIKTGGGKYCSRECYYKSNFGKKRPPLSDEWKRKIGISNKGKYHSFETKQKIRLANIGKRLSTETKEKVSNSLRGRKHTEETKKKMRENNRRLMLGKKHSEEAKRKNSEAHKGENSSRWQGGKSFEIYPSLFNIQLKERVRVRDNFVCQLCGIPELECNDRLSIHHIDYNKRNNKLNNLISLCRKCHARTNSDRENCIKCFEKVVNISERTLT